ncbi:DUF1531-domain-containing protein, partial [Westerdykella ornata]
SQLLSTWGSNFTRNTKAGLADMTPKDWIRLVIIVGTYCLLRPYLIKLGGRMQTKSHEADAAETEALGAEISPNDLRGGKKGKIEIPGVGDSSDEDEEESRPGDWGKKARVRQRKFIREALEREERRLAEDQEAESDKEIEQFLVD